MDVSSGSIIRSSGIKSQYPSHLAGIVVALFPHIWEMEVSVYVGSVGDFFSKLYLWNNNLFMLDSNLGSDCHFD
jgi:hypothetical protein